MVPEGWNRAKLGDLVVKVGSGVTPKGGSAFYKSSGVPLIRSQNVLWGRLSLDDVAYIDLAQHEKMNNTWVSNGDVLLNITGASIGRACIAPADLASANVNQHVCIIRPDKTRLDSRFLLDVILSPIGQRQIDRFQAGGNRQGLNFQQIRSFSVPLPPVEEQYRIAQILSTWDEAIARVQELINNSERQQTALMQCLFTTATRLPGYLGKWREERLGALTSIYDGTHSTPKYTESGVPFYSVEHVTSDDFSETKFISEEVFAKEVERVRLERDDILMTRIGDIGTAKLIDWDVRASFYVSLALIKASKHFHSAYMANYVNSSGFQRELYKRTIHVAFPKKINLGEIGECIVKLPPLEEQQAIASVLHSAANKRDVLKRDISLLQAEKKALMQQLLTGKRRVNVDGDVDRIVREAARGR